MRVGDETMSEIDEALRHLSDVVRNSEIARRETLLSMIDELLDAKLEKVRA